MPLASATVIIFSEAIWVPVCAALLVGEAFLRRDLAALIIASAGVLLISGTPNTSVMAVIAAFGDTTLFSVTMLISWIWLPAENAWVVMNMQLLVLVALYLAVILPFRCATEGHLSTVFFLRGFFAQIGETTSLLVVFGTASSFSHYWATLYVIMRAPPAALTSLMLRIYLTPAVCTLFGILVLREPLSLNSAAGIACIALSIIGHGVASGGSCFTSTGLEPLREWLSVVLMGRLVAYKAHNLVVIRQSGEILLSGYLRHPPDLRLVRGGVAELLRSRNLVVEKLPILLRISLEIETCFAS